MGSPWPARSGATSRGGLSWEWVPPASGVDQREAYRGCPPPTGATEAHARHPPRASGFKPQVWPQRKFWFRRRPFWLPSTPRHCPRHTPQLPRPSATVLEAVLPCPRPSLLLGKLHPPLGVCLTSRWPLHQHSCSGYESFHAARGAHPPHSLSSCPRALPRLFGPLSPLRTVCPMTLLACL